MKVLALYSDKDASGDYRVLFPAEVVNRLSREVEVETASRLAGDAIIRRGECTIKRIDIPQGVKVISFQRPQSMVGTSAIMWIRRHRPDIGIVIEMDQDIESRWTVHALRHCDVVTVPTAELARAYQGDGHQTLLIRDGVPASMLDNPAAPLLRRRSHKELNRERIVGWAGTATASLRNLEASSGALNDVIDGDRVKFRAIGPREGVAKGLGLDDGLVEASGPLSPDMRRIALGELDVGIIPLADTSENRVMSAVQALEMAAAGVPMIGSKLPEFELLRRQGMPILLVKDRHYEWRWALRRLLSLKDAELRDLSLQHREFIRRSATMEHRADDWANAWLTAHRIANLRVTRRAVAQR